MAKSDPVTVKTVHKTRQVTKKCIISPPADTKTVGVEGGVCTFSAVDISDFIPFFEVYPVLFKFISDLSNQSRITGGVISLSYAI